MGWPADCGTDTGANDEGDGGDVDAVIVCDLDGVIWRGDAPIPGAADAIATLRAAGRRVAFLTNNSSAPTGAVAARLARAGVDADPDDVLSSAQAAVALLADSLPAGARVLVCAGPGVDEAVRTSGFEAVPNDREPDAAVDAVVCGFHRDFDFDRLDRAAAAIRQGARFVATNADPTYPAEHRVLPGAGALVAAIATASGRTPEVAGKPEAPTAALVRARLGPHGIMVGDRPSTDGLLAARLGWPFAMVLSGIGGHDPSEPVPTPPPAHVADDLAGLVPALLGRAAG
jgi:HAD superfamily hydrolase (TIGR01450 family)